MSATTTDRFQPTFSPPPSFSQSPFPSPSPTNGFSSIFQSPGGPPLILVFIAAGLLLGAFIGVLVMRRLRPAPARQGGVGTAAFLAGLNSKPLGEKPKLVDIHLSPAPDAAAAGSNEHGTGKEKLGAHGAWGHVSPFAAAYLEAASPPARDRPRSRPAQSPSAAAPSASRTRSPLARLAARLPWATARWRAGAHELSPLGAGNAQPEARAVQLAVTVSMPSPQNPSYRPPNPSPNHSTHDIHAHAHAHVKHDEDDPMPDCCIGTVVVSYRHDPHDSDLPAPVSASPAAAAAAS